MTPSTSKAWAVDVLTIASDFPPLLYAILSFAAFYLAAVESHEYIDIARKLFNHYTSYHDTMQWPNSKNADSVALVCHFVSVLTFCEIRYDLSGHQTDRGPRSATTISTHHFSRSQAAFQKFCATRNLVHYKEALSNHLNADLLFWRKDDSNSAHQDAPGYRDVGYTYTQVSHLIDAVSAAIELNFGHEPRPMISSFFGLLPQTFMGLLNERQPRAFIVIAIFFSAVGRVREMWWAEGVGENMINSVRSSLTDDWNRILDQSLKSGLSR